MKSSFVSTNEFIESMNPELGKASIYKRTYNPDVLFPIPRRNQRLEIKIDSNELPFFGFDLWNHYEVSWLNSKGKPLVAIAEIILPCESPNIVESKTLKLYFNSLNDTKFENLDALYKVIKQDLENKIQDKIILNIKLLNNFSERNLLREFNGICLDDLDVECKEYEVQPDFLRVESEAVEEILYSNLLNSNCLVTNQPDWGSVQISYSGKKINHEDLLKYIVSFRHHNEFHEHCIERMFMDIMTRCKPQKLAIYGKYTRRGGIDINPFRTTEKNFQVPNFDRLCRQ